MSLDEQLDQRRKEIFSDRLSMSIGELESLYARDEIDVHPKFQRILRWSDEQKTKLIESILLRIPVPAIFVAQDSSGKWDVVDGVQRLGTILEFLGVLKDQAGDLKIPLVLTATKLLPALDGKSFENRLDPTKALSQAQRLDLRRSRLDIHIILKESDPSSKYELFERLNTGGSLASPQEVRNCVLVWINEPFFDWMLKLASFSHFVEAVQLPERLEQEQFRMELVLRFLVFAGLANEDLKGIGDLTTFLNEANRRLPDLMDAPHRAEAEAVFNDTFTLLVGAAGSDSFRKFDASKESFRGAFLISAFEAIALGVAKNISAWRTTANATAIVQSKILQLWNDPDFTDHIGTGVAAKSRIQHSIPFGRGFFAP